MRSIAARLGRSPSTISRDLARNAGRPGGYRVTTAHALAYGRASRTTPAKLATNLALPRQVEHDLGKSYSPEQIAGRLRQQFPDDPDQYFPKGIDLSMHSAADLDWVAQELNDRPRKRLGFRKPIEEIGDLLLR